MSNKSECFLLIRKSIIWMVFDHCLWPNIKNAEDDHIYFNDIVSIDIAKNKKE